MRSCDGCVACCVLLGVPEIGKDQMTCCPKLDPVRPGCSIYETRPQPCRDFACLWLQERLPSSARPKTCGVVFADQQTFGEACVTATEIWDGALETEDIASMIAELAQSHLVITISRRRGTEIYGPQARRDEVVTKLKTTGFPVATAMSDETYAQLQTMMRVS